MRVIATALLLAGLAWAPAPAEAIDASTGMELGKTAAIGGDGATALVRVHTTCPSGFEVLEAFVYISQDGATSSFAGVPATCDGERHAHDVVVAAGEQPFEPGRANLSGYLLVLDPVSQQTESASPARRIRLLAAA